MPTTCRRLYRLRVFTVKEAHAALLPSSLYEKNFLRIKVTNIEKQRIVKANPSCNTVVHTQSTNIYRAPQYMYLRRNQDFPTPLLQASVHTRLRLWGWGWGSPSSDDWRKSLALCLLCEYIVRSYDASILMFNPGE